MDERVDNLAGVVAAVTEAAATSLDPVSILRRTRAALEPMVAVAAMSLWRSTRGTTELVAADADVGLSDAVDFAVEEARPGASVHPIHRQGHPHGQLVVVADQVEPLRPDQEAVLRIAAVQVASALERVELFQEVMELERLKSDFIARVSHELRTPITIISGFVETLLAHGEELTVDQRNHMLERSQVALARLGQLIEELLILSRLEGGVLTPEAVPTDLAAFCEEVRLGSVEPAQVVVVAGPAVTALTDPALLARALGLVVDNAIKYGGTAELSISSDATGAIVEVRDRGAGFAPDVESTAFEMFTRSQTVASTPGLGVGLAIARTIIEVLDGSIEIGPADPGPGASVTIRLPF